MLQIIVIHLSLSVTYTVFSDMYFIIIKDLANFLEVRICVGFVQGKHISEVRMSTHELGTRNSKYLRNYTYNISRKVTIHKINRMI